VVRTGGLYTSLTGGKKGRATYGKQFFWNNNSFRRINRRQVSFVILSV
jgi:hypothetical protein